MLKDTFRVWDTVGCDKIPWTQDEAAATSAIDLTTDILEHVMSSSGLCEDAQHHMPCIVIALSLSRYSHAPTVIVTAAYSSYLTQEKWRDVCDYA